MEFPQEVLELILIHLDGKSLARVSQVNSVWKYEVERISEKRRIWENICTKEIPKYALDDISKKHSLFQDCPCDRHHAWRSVYVSWCQWPRLAQHTKTTRELCEMKTTAEMVTCAKVSGNCVITGHAMGHVMVWCRYNGLIAHAKPNDSRIMDMLLIDVNGVSKYAQADELGTMSHDVVITTAFDGMFAVTMLSGGTVQPDGIRLLDPGPLVLRVHHQTLTEIRSLDTHLFSVTSAEDTMSLWKVTPVTEKVQPLIQRIAYCRIPPLEHKNEVVRKLNLAKLLAAKNVQWTISHSPVCNCDNCLLLVIPPNKLVQEPKFFKHDVGIWMSYEPVPMLHIAVLKSSCNVYTTKHYDALVLFESCPSCFLLYGPVLFVGLDSGIVLMYIIRDTADLSKLQLDKPDWRHAISSNRITTLDVNDGQYGLGVMATTVSQVFYVAFDLPGV